MRVSVVVPNWNGRRFLLPLLQDLREQTLRPAEVIVVDNGSQDDSVSVAESTGAKAIRFETNRGFAVAVNAGVQAAAEDLVAVLNNDLRLDRQYVENLAGAFGSRHSFAVGKVLSIAHPERIDATFDAICRGGTAWRCGSGMPDGPLWNTPRIVAFPPFTAVLFRKRSFLDLGGLDEAFGSYLEDVDFGLRSASAGHTGAYVPDAVCWHVGSGTLGRWSPQTVRLIARNQVLLLARHYDGPALRRLAWQIAVAQLLWGAVAIRNGQGMPWLRGKLEGLSLFRRHRGPALANLETVLTDSEQLIRSLQPSSLQDTYWHWYFRLTS